MIVYCKNCGKQISDDSIFCSSCGVSQKLPSANVERHEEKQSYKENSQRYNKFDIIFFLLFVFLISMHVYYSISYADYKKHYTVGQHNYDPLYNVCERFTGCGYHLSSYAESSDVKEILSSSNILGHHISTLGFQDNVIDYSYMYNYQCYISTYDISNIMSVFGNNDKIYEKCLSQLAQRTHAKEIILENGNIKALTWYGNGSMPTKYLGVCANERLYIIEAQSEKNLDYRSNWLFSLFDFTYYQHNKNYQSTLLIIILLIGICCVFFLAVNMNKYKKLSVLNRYAYSLFLLSLLSILVNFVITLVISDMLNEVIFDNWPIIVLVGAEATAFLSSLYLCVLFYRKSKIKWDKYYLVPPVLNDYFYSCLKSDVSKKTFIKWVCYPMMILSLLPCGFYIFIIYSIPLLLIIIYNRWHNWVSASKM